MSKIMTDLLNYSGHLSQEPATILLLYQPPERFKKHQPMCTVPNRLNTLIKIKNTNFIGISIKKKHNVFYLERKWKEESNFELVEQKSENNESETRLLMDNRFTSECSISSV